MPVVANGGVACFEDAQKCLSFTKANGVMSSEAILEYPALFSQSEELVDQDEIIQRYLEFTQIYKDEEKLIKSHLFKLAYIGLI